MKNIDKEKIIKIQHYSEITGVTLTFINNVRFSNIFDNDNDYKQIQFH